MLTRIGDKPCETIIYKDEFQNTVLSNDGTNNYKITNKDNSKNFEILFQNGFQDIVGFTGVTNEQLISILIDRITKLDRVLHSDHNTHAIFNLQSALGHLHSRLFLRNIE